MLWIVSNFALRTTSVSTRCKHFAESFYKNPFPRVTRRKSLASQRWKCSIYFLKKFFPIERAFQWSFGCCDSKKKCFLFIFFPYILGNVLASVKMLSNFKSIVLYTKSSTYRPIFISICIWMGLLTRLLLCFNLAMIFVQTDIGPGLHWIRCNAFHIWIR